MFLLCTILAACLSVAHAIDWSAKELEPYDIANANGIFKGTTFHYGSHDSSRIEHWYLGVNQTLGDDIQGCKPGLELCGVFFNNQEPGLENDEPVSFGPEYDSVEYRPNHDGVSIIAKSKRRIITINLSCFQGDDYVLEAHNYDREYYINLVTKGGCLKQSWKGKNPFRPLHDMREHWGWFTWIFIFMVLFSSIYIVGGAWFQYSKGNAIDFKSALKEVLQNGLDLLRGMPSFISEIIERITRRSQSRGEYSAL